MLDSLLLAAGLGVVAILSAFGGLVILAMLQRAYPEKKTNSVFHEGEDATIFIFDEKDLLDATPSAQRLLTGSSFPDKPWYALMERLAGRFENLEDRLGELALSGYVVLSGLPRTGAQPISLRAELRGGLTRITLVNPGRENKMHLGDVLTMHALDSELVELRDAANAAHFPIWRLSTTGEVTWANSSYMEMLFRTPVSGEVLDWPFRHLFDVTNAKADPKDKPLRRFAPDRSGWFDVTIRPVDEGVVCYAVPADTIVLVEGALQDFKQTLTNTFAELATGLAVFDNSRRLQLFNPALAKLIDVPIDFLLKRPALFTLLDGMRDRNMLPEPKDYKSWRRQMVDLEAMSTRGEYQENWHLPNGKAFRVVGRPYPNGAVALMIDDITDQIVRDRLSRMELDLALTILSRIDEAVIAFSPLGMPIFTNEAYRSLWGHDPVAEAGTSGAIEVLEAWRAQSAPSLIWSEVEALMNGAKADIGAQTIDLLDGAGLTCRAQTLPDGGIGIFFRRVNASASAAEPVSMIDRLAASA